KVRFPNHTGDQLSAYMDLPLGKRPRACAIFAHCFTCTANLHAVRHISLALTQAGIAVFRFDFTGLGQSEGAFEETNFSTNVDDLLAAAAFMQQHYESPQLLLGHSLGGAAALMAAAKIDSVKAVATIGAPSDAAHVAHLFEDAKAEILEEGEAVVNIGGRPFKVKKQFLDDLEQVQPEVIRKLRKALLIMHSPQDTVVGIEHAARIYQMARHPKSFISLDGADHLLSKKEDALYAGRMVASWASRYVNMEERDDLRTDQQVVVRTGAKGYTTEIRAGEHRLLADEPQSVGGANLGPTPYGLLSAALGACTSMTLRMYADRKQWDLQEVRVHLSHTKDYAQDSAHSELQGSKIDVFIREIELEGQLDENQRQRLLEIADKCPVHRTLHGPIEVRTRLRE
ncbi:MAG: alpha/beta fold hydrolase, partial [Bacteroidetes bacterium]